jgi:enediyne biosynthesis protein E9
LAEASIYDFAIVGSGYGGFIPALRLAEHGFSVVVLEKGREFADSDFRQSYSPSYFRKLYDCWYASDYAAFYTTARTLGGGSVLNAGASIRAPSEAFHARLRGKPAWPRSVTRRTLEPFYDLVQNELGIRQIEWGAVSKAGGKFAQVLGAAGLACERASFNFRDCLQCGYCQAGCSFGRKNTGVGTYIEKSRRLGARYVTRAEALKVSKRGDIFEVAYRRGWRERTLRAHRVILAAGTFGNVKILHNSRNSLPTLSDRVGAGFNTSGALSFLIELPESDPEYFCYMGQTNPGIYCYDYWDSGRFVLHATTVPLAVLGAVPLRYPGEPTGVVSGEEFKRRAETLFPHKVLGGAVHGISGHTGTVRVAGGGLRIENGPTPELRAYVARVHQSLDEMCRKAGARLILTGDEMPFDMSTTLVLSTCAMADSVDDGVVDPEGKVFNCPGLYITDGSVIPSSLGVNPYFSLAANAERLSAAIVADQKGGRV